MANTEQHSFIRVDPEMTFPVKEIEALGACVPQVLRNYLNQYFEDYQMHLIHLYNFYYYLKASFTPVETDLTIKRISEKDDYLVEAFYKKFSDFDLDDADIDFDKADPVIWGGFKNDEMIAYSSHRYSSESIADTGVLVDSQYRGKGYGKAIVGKDVSWCLERGVVPMYVVRTANTKSIKLVEGLGYDRIFDVYVLAAKE